jgi:hypothetical protein
MAVTKRTGLSEGPHFSAKYTVLLNKWRTRLSTALNREVANCIIEGARNARGGERLDSNSVAAGSIHLFASIQPRLWDSCLLLIWDRVTFYNQKFSGSKKYWQKSTDR